FGCLPRRRDLRVVVLVLLGHVAYLRQVWHARRRGWHLTFWRGIILPGSSARARGSSSCMGDASAFPAGEITGTAYDQRPGVSMFGAVPGLQVIASYRRRWLVKDVIAGVVLTTLLVPQGMAYAELAGLPPITGLYTSILCLLGYAV